MAAEKPRIGSIAWADLTVADAPGVRDFYRAVVGWEPAPVKMGDYDDYCMNLPGTDQAAVGICHARGLNAGLPAQWLIYVPVKDLEASARKVVELGGKILVKHQVGYIIQDSAGAVMVISQA